MSEFLTLRPEVQAFAQAMEAELRKNDHKSGWKHMAPFPLFQHARQEFREVEVAYTKYPRNNEEFLSECADVANMLMMVCDVLKLLPGDCK